MGIPTSNELAQILEQLRVNQVYNPYTDTVRAEMVIVIGKNDVFRFPVALMTNQDAEFREIFIIPRRREPRVVVYVKEVVTLGNSEAVRVHVLDRPYRWVKAGSKWGVLFPATRRIPSVQVRTLPTDPAMKPVKIGPLNEVSHRIIAKHLSEMRIVEMKRFNPRGAGSRFGLAYPQRQRPTLEVINWDNFSTGRYGEGAWSAKAPVPTLRWYRLFASVNTPGFRFLKKGRLPVNPYSLTRIQVEDPMGMDYRMCWYQPWNYQSQTHYPSSWYIPTPAGPTHDVSAYNLALRRCISSAELGIDGNLAQDLAQIGQLTNMMGDSIHRIVAAIRNTKRGRFKDAWECLTTPTAKSRGLGYRVSGEGARKSSRSSVLPMDFRVDMLTRVDVDLGRVVSASKSVAENWLALQYGWKPLLSDINGAIIALAELMSDPGEDVVRTAKGSGKTVQKQKMELGTSSSWYQKTGMLETTTYSRCKIGFRYRVDSQLKAFLAQTGFTNPINLAWEVLPYSFVVDWFIPIGPYLETLSAYDGLVFLDGYVTKATMQYTSAYHEYSGPFPAYPGLPIVWTKKARYWREYLLINRIKLWSFPVAEMPSFKNPFSVEHALNGLALLRAAFK